MPAAAVTASSSTSGFPSSSVYNPATFERWRPGQLPATLEIDAGEPVDCDYVGIVAHTLGDEECSLIIEKSDDGDAWQEIESAEFNSNEAFLLLFERTTARYWRLRIDGESGTPQIGVVYVGEALAMQRPIYGGHTPGKLNRTTTFQNNKSENGQFLGRSIVRKGYSESLSWGNLTAAWYRENFDPFVEAARTTPFFVAWRPGKFPDEVLYAWTSDDIAPNNSGTRDLVSVSIDVEGLG